jgi:hypothetical protein
MRSREKKVQFAIANERIKELYNSFDDNDITVEHLLHQLFFCGEWKINYKLIRYNKKVLD